MNQLLIVLLVWAATCFTLPVVLFSQTAFTGPVISSQAGASNSYNAVVVGPETVNPASGCSEWGSSWTHNFNGTANKRINGFTIVATSYFVNNYGNLTTIIRRNNLSGSINPAGCNPTAIPWNDRQIVFFEGTEDVATNVTQIVNSFPSTILPGTAGYDAVNEMNLVFSRGFINSGADNIFNNRAGTGAGFNSNANNIERMDIFVSGGVAVTAANLNRVGFVIACRGPADDPFVLSAIKGMAGGNNIGGGTNYVYDDVIKVNATWVSKTINGGAPIAIPAAARVTLLAGINSVVLRRMDSTTALDDLLPTASYLTISSYVAAQNIVGMFFTFGDLGLSPGDVFYGYSVAGNDVTAVNSDQYNSYLNSTYFPLTTTPADGGVDLSGFPGMFAAMDIDDDDDGLPDYLEFNSTVAFQDHDTDGIPNWSDVNYPGFVDNNTDGVNDNFDPSADSDNDLIPNYRDSGFPGFTDSNSDGVNDNFDKDLDGIPNHTDLDSDNDGIPDVVECFGVDANGDGRIDNFTDLDADGLSQNVDASSTGPIGSGAGLGNLDTDGDGIPNYLDLDSDNDGIPDVIEAYGTDANNDGKIDGYTNADLDGYSGNVDGDADNDGTAENQGASLLRTGTDGDADGRTDSFPYKNMDSDTKANPYDMDSDHDGILDVIEAGFPDGNNDGVIDGAINSDGWNAAVAGAGSLNLPNTDAVGRVNVYDIDSDEDGIPDNVEGLPTSTYVLPANTDTDGDGLDNSYDNVVGFGGNGIPPVDVDGDTVPDYLDDDTDSDGLVDIIEGNDLDLNGEPDDNVTLTGIDTDDDGLDDRFDSDNGSANGTSGRMGNGGSFIGSPTPGSITPVQQTPAVAMDRDWRWIEFILDCDFRRFDVILQGKKVLLDWWVYSRQPIEYFDVERSIDGVNFERNQSLTSQTQLFEVSDYHTTDDISDLSVQTVYYRLKAVSNSGRIKYSPIVAVRLNSGTTNSLRINPNPVTDQMQIIVQSERQVSGEIMILNSSGKLMLNKNYDLRQGVNHLSVTEVKQWSTGLYFVIFQTKETKMTCKVVLNR